MITESSRSPRSPAALTTACSRKAAVGCAAAHPVSHPPSTVPQPAGPRAAVPHGAGPRLIPPWHRHCGCWLCPAQPSAEGQPGRDPAQPGRAARKGKLPQLCARSREPAPDHRKTPRLGRHESSCREERPLSEHPKKTAQGCPPPSDSPPGQLCPSHALSPRWSRAGPGPGWQRGLPAGSAWLQGLRWARGLQRASSAVPRAAALGRSPHAAGKQRELPGLLPPSAH